MVKRLLLMVLPLITRITPRDCVMTFVTADAFTEGVALHGPASASKVPIIHLLFQNKGHINLLPIGDFH